MKATGMQLSEQAVQEFESLWKEDFPNSILDAKELRKKAAQVFMAFQLVYRPIPYDKRDSFAKLKPHSKDDI